jgi:hypothetical protein
MEFPQLMFFYGLTHSLLTITSITTVRIQTQILAPLWWELCKQPHHLTLGPA